MSPALTSDLLGILDEISGGVHAGFRPAHAKGLMCIGTFSPSPEAAGLTRAPHANRPSTPVTVRYSDSTGIPTIPDNDPARAESLSASISPIMSTPTSLPTPPTASPSVPARSNRTNEG